MPHHIKPSHRLCLANRLCAHQSVLTRSVTETVGAPGPVLIRLNHRPGPVLIRLLCTVILEAVFILGFLMLGFLQSRALLWGHQGFVTTDLNTG